MHSVMSEIWNSLHEQKNIWSVPEMFILFLKKHVLVKVITESLHGSLKM